MDYQDFREEIIRLVKIEIGNEDWFKGVNCTDTRDYYRDYERGELTMDQCVECVVGDTEFWDYPWWRLQAEEE